ncbi:hypothetical protein C4585_00090 [Candidatus Parcubacteria bacterium]|nr:MAG: hypothetical protein C4585_00090 [Candidatus Parcubacteria bacterium]
MEIDAALELHRRKPKERHGQQLLAREVTKLVHGEGEVAKAEKVSQMLFNDVGIVELSASEGESLAKVAPSTQVKIGDILLDTIVSSGLASSKREARQFLEEKAISLNGEVTKDEKRKLSEEDFPNGFALLKRGKKYVCVLSLR